MPQDTHPTTPPTTPPLTPHVTDHGGGVRGIKVPIPDNPLGHTLVHVLDTDRGPVLIDTGWDDPQSWDTLVAGLAALGIAVADVHGVVITHHHPDHHGLSGRVREASGAWIAMHAADTEVVVRTRSAEPGVWFDYMSGKLAAAGAPEEHVAPLRARASGRMLPMAFGTGGAPTCPGCGPPSPTGRSSPASCSPSPGAGSAPSGPPGTPPATSACTWRNSTRRTSPATAASSPGTTCCPGSPHTSVSTRLPTRTESPGSPTPSATTSTLSNASAASAPPRSSRRTSTPSPTPPPAYGNCCATTRND